MRLLSIKRPQTPAQAMAEFAIILPLVLIFFCSIVDFGFYFYDYIGVQSALREGARALIQTAETASPADSYQRVRTLMMKSHDFVSPIRDSEIKIAALPRDPAFGGEYTSVTLEIHHTHEFMFPMGILGGLQAMPIRSQMKFYLVPGFAR